MTDLDKAREWAKLNIDGGYFRPGNRALDAAEIIQSLPDQWVDAEKLREALDGWSLAGKALRETDLGKQLEALIPTPKLPTLADMTQEEREACQWMQCKVETDDEDTIGVIWMIWSNRVHIIFQSGIIFDAESRKVTPLPDLPKLEWPGGTPDDVAYATGGVLTTQDVVDECRAVRKERALPRPEDVPPNEPWLIEIDGEKYVGTRYEGRTIVPWSVAALDGVFAGDYSDNEITLIHKLVPEPPALPEGMRLADHEEYGRVIVLPKADKDGDYKIFFPFYEGTGSARVKHKSELTFLGGDQHA